MMASRPLLLSPRLVAAAFVAAGLLAGLALAFQVRWGLALILFLSYGVLVLIDLPLGIALWVALLFVSRLEIVWIAPLAATVMLAVAWLGHLRPQQSAMRAALARHWPLAAAVTGLVLWLGLSGAWSAEPSRALAEIGFWLWAGVAFVVVATALTTTRDVTLVGTAFVVGAMVSVTVGWIDLDLLRPTDPEKSIVSLEGRLSGGIVNPNDLAIAVVPAIALAAGLVGGAVRGPRRGVAFVGMVLLAVGLAATQSRGGFVAAAAAVCAALVLAGDRRVHVLAVLAFLGAGAGTWFATSPDAWERVTSFEEGGTGRSELWDVGWGIYGDHPIVGVGFNQFEVHSPRYVREVGDLEFVELIADRSLEAHNIYLELLVETGPLGLALLVLVLAGCLRAAWSAALRFDANGERALGGLARAVTVAIAAIAVGLFFSSNVTDLPLWVAFALGPALLTAARRREGSPAG